LYAISPNGDIEWRRELEGATRPVVFGDAIATTTVDGHFHVMDLATGADRFTLRLDDRAPSPIHLLGTYAVVTTTHGGLYVLDTSAPHIHAQLSPDSSGFASAAILAPDHIIAFDNEGVLHGLTLRLR
jgi:outer membrane protein assembly factor BamB